MSFYLLPIIIVFLFYGSYLLFGPPRAVRPPRPDLFDLTHNVPPPPHPGISDDDQKFITATCQGLHIDARAYVREFLDGKIDGWEFADAVAALPAPEPEPPRLNYQEQLRAIRRRHRDLEKFIQSRRAIPTDKDREIAAAVWNAKHNTARPIILTGGMEIAPLSDLNASAPGARVDHTLNRKASS